MSQTSQLDLRVIFRSFPNLQRLKELCFPNDTTNNIMRYPRYQHTTHVNARYQPCPEWPPALRKLYLAGTTGHPEPLFRGGFPSNLTHLAIGRCPGIRNNDIYHWLESTGKSLQYFQVGDAFRDIPLDGYLDNIIKFMPRLRHLSITHAFISELFFKSFRDEAHDVDSPDYIHHPLEILEIDFQTVWYEDTPLDLQASMVLDAFHSGLGNLKVLRYHLRLGWNAFLHRPFLLQLCSLMIEKAEKSGEGDQIAVTMFHEFHGDMLEETFNRSNLSEALEPQDPDGPLSP